VGGPRDQSPVELYFELPDRIVCGMHGPYLQIDHTADDYFHPSLCIAWPMLNRCENAVCLAIDRVGVLFRTDGVRRVRGRSAATTGVVDQQCMRMRIP
jgi:hypothetical protein